MKNDILLDEYLYCNSQIPENSRFTYFEPFYNAFFYDTTPLNLGYPEIKGILMYSKKYDFYPCIAFLPTGKRVEQRLNICIDSCKIIFDDLDEQYDDSVKKKLVYFVIKNKDKLKRFWNFGHIEKYHEHPFLFDYVYSMKLTDEDIIQSELVTIDYHLLDTSEIYGFDFYD